jgi:hypothetical protein
VIVDRVGEGGGVVVVVDEGVCVTLAAVLLGVAASCSSVLRRLPQPTKTNPARMASGPNLRIRPPWTLYTSESITCRAATPSGRLRPHAAALQARSLLLNLLDGRAGGHAKNVDQQSKAGASGTHEPQKHSEGVQDRARSRDAQEERIGPRHAGLREAKTL